MAIFWLNQKKLHMKDRIRKLMESQNMTQQNFATFIGKSPATLSSIFNGRTRPTLDIIEAIKNAFPKLSTDWLLFGRGEMYVSDEEKNLQNLTESNQNSQSPTLPFDFTAEQNVAPEKKNVKIMDAKPRKITEIRIFYDDQTWETFVSKK